MTLEIELADGTVHTFNEEYVAADSGYEAYIHRIDDNDELVVLRVLTAAAGPSGLGPEHEVARYPKDAWRSVGEVN